MVKTLKAGDTVWRYDGKPKQYMVTKADDATGIAGLVDGEGSRVWGADYDYLWRTEMRCLRDLCKQLKRELRAATKEYLKIEGLLNRAIAKGVK